MRVEQVRPHKPSFPWVVFCFCTAIILIFIAGIIVVSVHYRKKQKPPYSQHPVSQVVPPARTPPLA